MEKRDNLLEVIKTLFRYKKHIISTVGLVGIGAAIIVMLLPVYYQSTTKFYPASQDLAAVENIFGRSSARTYYYGTDEDVERVMAIAKSNELALHLIDTFNLYKVYDIDTSDARASYYVMEAFEELYNVKQSKENAIEVSIEDEDPDLAAAIVNEAHRKINETGQELIKFSQYQTFSTIENGFIDRDTLLRNVEKELQELREKHGIYNVESQGGDMASQIGKLTSSVQADSIKIAFWKIQGRRDSVRNISIRRSANQQEITSLQGRLNNFNEGLSKVASLLEIQEVASGEMAYDREQLNRIKSAFNSSFPTTMLLEEGKPAVIKSRPKRTLTVLAAMVLAFIFCVFGVLIFDNYKDVDWKEVVDGK